MAEMAFASPLAQQRSRFRSATRCCRLRASGRRARGVEVVRQLRWFSLVAIALVGCLNHALRAHPNENIWHAGQRPIVVGVELNAAPAMFSLPDGTISGFAPELVQAVAEAGGFPVRFTIGPWDSILQDFKDRKIDMLAQVAYTADRTKYMDFAVSHLTMEGAVYARSGERRIERIEDLGRVRVAVIAESFSHVFLRSRGLDRNLVRVRSLREGFRALIEDEADAVISIRLIGNNLINQEKLWGIDALPLRDPGIDFRLHMAVHSGETELLHQVNEGLAAIRANGTYERLYETWIGGLDTRIRWRDVAPFALPSGAVALCGIVAFFWQRRLLRRLKRQADQLHASQRQLTLVLEASQDGFWDLDAPHNRIERSARWSEMLGYAPDAIAPEPEALFRLVHTEDLPALRLALDLILQPGRPARSRFEYRVRHADGSWRWVLDRAKVVSRDSDDRPIRVVGTTSDITARRNMEAALQRSETLLRQSQEAAGIGGWEIDLSTRALFWTQETYRIHEVPYGEDGQVPTIETAINFYAPESQSSIRSAVELAMYSGQPFDLDLEIITATGRRSWVRSIGRVLRNDTGRIIKVYGSFQDITERKRNEAEQEKFQRKILETQKLESLGVLAGGVAHDFNNLLTAIMANAQLARLSTIKGTDLDEHVESIEKASHRAADLCRHLLAYAGRTPMSMQPTHINDLVLDTVRLLEVSVGKSARLELALGKDVPQVEVDVGQINQVLMNLVLNAAEALPASGGLIRVQTGAVFLNPAALQRAQIGQDRPPARYVYLEISDTGCGMSKDTLSRIFDPFFTTKFTGRGLGLAAVLGIVRSHRGAFFVESELGKGSTFRLCLPIAKVATPLEETSAPVVPESPRSVRPSRVLLVDDEGPVRDVAAEVLRKKGCIVETGIDGRDGVEKFKAASGQFDAVVLDLTMPGMDGVATLRALREIRPDVRVLMMSGYSDRESAFAASDLRPDDFLRKPFTLQELHAKIAPLLTPVEARSGT